MGKSEQRPSSPDEETQEIEAVLWSAETRQQTPVVEGLTALGNWITFAVTDEEPISVILSERRARLIKLFLRNPGKVLYLNDFGFFPNGTNRSEMIATINSTFKAAGIPAVIVEKSPGNFYLSPVLK